MIIDINVKKMDKIEYNMMLTLINDLKGRKNIKDIHNSITNIKDFFEILYNTERKTTDNIVAYTDNRVKYFVIMNECDTILSKKRYCNTVTNCINSILETVNDITYLQGGNTTF